MRSCSAITNGRRLSGRCKGTAVAANDTWAVGTITDPTTGFGRTLTEHLDGTSWSVITGPNATTGQNALNGGAALRTGDVVAVGFAIDANGHTNNLILHS